MGLFGLGGNKNGTGVVHHTVALAKDPNGASAVNLQKIEDEGGLGLRKKTEAVAVSLRKANLSGIRAQVLVILDHSGSMYSDYQNGKVQDIVERFLGFGLAVDVDGEIPVIAFDHKLHDAVNVNMSNYSGIVSRSIYKPSQMGSTDLTKALEKVRTEASQTDTPLFVAVITDGEPDDRDSAEEVVKALAGYPVFIKFLAIRPVRFLEKLDDLGSSERLLDNVDAKSYRDLASVSDEQFAADMVDEWDSWTKAAIAAGVLTDV